jgi:hypothetical protein
LGALPGWGSKIQTKVSPASRSTRLMKMEKKKLQKWKSLDSKLLDRVDSTVRRMAIMDSTARQMMIMDSARTASLVWVLLLLVGSWCGEVIAAESNLPKFNLAVVSFSSRREEDNLLIESNHKEYAQKHGYGHMYGHDIALAGGRRPHWAKIPMLQKALETYEWAMWLDGDAMFLNQKVSVEEVLQENGFFERDNKSTISLVFSGDTTIINTGVLLFRRTSWTTQILEEIWNIGGVHDAHRVTVGVGLDNGAFCVYFGGCTVNSTIDEMRACYRKADEGYHNKAVAVRVQSADPTIFASIVPQHILANVYPLPQRSWNSYRANEAKFIYHLAGEDAAHKTLHIKNHLGGKHGHNHQHLRP